MARTSSLSCLPCRNPYQTPHSLNCLPPFHWKSLFITEKCFVASPSQKSALIRCALKGREGQKKKSQDFRPRIGIFIGDKFGESLVGSQAPLSFWEVPRLPQKLPELPRKFSATSPEVLSLWNLTAIRKVSPRKFPELPLKFPKLPRKFRNFPEVSPFSGKPDTLTWLTKTFSHFRAHLNRG